MVTDATPTPPQIRGVSQEDFDQLYLQLRRWGQYEQPGRGAWGRVGPADVLRGAASVQSGRTVSMALPWNGDASVDNPNPALHFMYDMGDREAPEPSTNKDFLGINFHGKACSHLDGLSHIAYRGELFDGHVSRDVVHATGVDFGSVSDLDHLVTSGVLLDFTLLGDGDWVEPGTAFGPDEILAAEEKIGEQLQPGDAVLIRSGHVARRAALGEWDSGAASAGLHVDAMPLLSERGVSVIGADGDSDVRPSPTPGIHSPIHILALTAMGIPLLDNLDLEDLAVACREEGRYRFMFTIAPLNVPRGTGSPVNPIAVF